MKNLLAKNVDYTLAETNFDFLGPKTTGKVRDIYEHDGKMVFATTDRYSAFDRNLALIPHKGRALTAITKFWFDATEDIVPNHIIAYPDPNVIIAKKCAVIPVEVVVRGYITGVTETSLWTHYSAGTRNFGTFTLPDNMIKNQRLETPVITPSAKGERDENITEEEVVTRGLVSEEIWTEVREKALELFTRGQDVALERGLILVDTKYEFGLSEHGIVTLIDEIHTPDSSRYWMLDSYEERFADGKEPEYFDKEFLRLWFREQCDPYKDTNLPDAPKEKIIEMAKRYTEICARITSEKCAFPFNEKIDERIESNLKKYFNIN